MPTGRSVIDFEKVYIDGFDMSGYTSDPGERGVEYARHDLPVIGDVIKGGLVGKPDVVFGPLNGVFDNTAGSGISILADAAKGTRRNVMHMRGVRGAVGVGDDAFCGPFLQTVHKTGFGDLVTAKLEFAYDATAGLNYDEFFGNVVHLFASETGANASNTPNVNNGAASAAGGWMAYQILSITGAGGTATLSIDDSANGTAWTALSVSTTGAVAQASAPTAGFIQLATNATVRQYLRWQLSLSVSTACVFALAFMRGR